MPTDTVVKTPETPKPEGTTGEPTPSAKEKELEAKLATETAARQQSDTRYAHLRQLQSRQATELAGYRGRDQVGGDVRDPGDPHGPNGQGLQPQGEPAPRAQTLEEVDAQADVAMIKFRQEVPAWADYWEDIMKITSDPLRAPAVASYGKKGQLDVYRSLHNAYRDVRLARLDAAKKDTEAARIKLEEKQAATRRDSFISGGGTAEAPQSFSLEDVEKMTYQEAIAAGIVPVSQKDPPLQNEPQKPTGS